jgi:DNA-binding response OmpR family regulator
MTEDKVQGFKYGGDDYLTKPFSVEELQLRIKALLRRVNIKVDKPEDKIISIGHYVFDTENLSLTIQNSKKSLTKKEAQILKLLYKFNGEVILNAVWGQNDYFVGRSLDVFITKLRKYLKDDDQIVLSNIHGVGFKLEIIK